MQCTSSAPGWSHSSSKAPFSFSDVFCASSHPQPHWCKQFTVKCITCKMWTFSLTSFPEPIKYKGFSTRSFLYNCLQHFIVTKSRGCNMLVQSVDSTQCLLFLPMTYLADEWHKCKEQMFLPCITTEASSDLNTPLKWLWTSMLFYLYNVSWDI